MPSNLKEERNQNSILQTEKNKAVFALYADMKFGNYVNSKEDAVLKYGMEYIISGKDSDKKNLTAAVEKIIAIRNAMNMAYLITDHEKMGEISTVSASAATALGLPFLEPVIKVALMEAWSLAEAVSDTRSLLKGEKIPILKNATNWKTSMTNLVSSSQTTSNSDYGLNVQKKYNSEFLMAKCFQSLEVKADFETEPLFTAMPWAMKLLSENGEAYEYSIRYANQY